MEDCLCVPGYGTELQVAYEYHAGMYCASDANPWGVLTAQITMQECMDLCTANSDCGAITRYHSGGNVGRCEFHPLNFGAIIYYNDRDWYYKKEDLLIIHSCTPCSDGKYSVGGHLDACSTSSCGWDAISEPPLATTIFDACLCNDAFGVYES